MASAHELPPLDGYLNMADMVPVPGSELTADTSMASRTPQQTPVAPQSFSEGVNQNLIAPLEQFDAVAQLVSKDMVSELTPSIQTWARNTAQSVTAVHAAVQAFEVDSGQAFMQTAGAMAQAGMAAAIYGENVSKAMAKAAKVSIASIAEQAGVQAVYALAEGLAYLAKGIFFSDPAAMVAAETDFAAAAEFGAIAGVAGAASAAINTRSSSGSAGRGSGGNNSAGSGGGGSGSGVETGGYGMAPSAVRQPSGNLTVMVMGDQQAGQWLATTLNTAVQRGVPLNATTVQKSPYAAG
jgi:hypothetical protein